MIPLIVTMLVLIFALVNAGPLFAGREAGEDFSPERRGMILSNGDLEPEP
jgi:hypothetical protein